MRVVTTQRGLEAFRGGSFVPTMGALHDGHLTLIRAAAGSRADGRGPEAPVVVSVFVNPTQFNDPADLARYPRTLERDAALCAAAGADAVFAPGVDEVYPPGASPPVPPLPAVATGPGLEDAHRPGHFAGVCQVVARLFELVRPRSAWFGEKDWQQLQVVRAMVRDSGSPVRVLGVPTVRDPDGLAMSSRNVFLSPTDRRRGLALPRALAVAGAHAEPDAAEEAMRAVLTDAGVGIDYAVVREASTLLRPGGARTDAAAWRALVAGRVGTVRLLDNAPWPTENAGGTPVGSSRVGF